MRQLTRKLESASSWKEFVQEARGPTYLSSRLEEISHPAIPLLQRWRDKGVPAKSSSPPWTQEQKDHCIQRGCHVSAIEHQDFLRGEMTEFVENGFWAVLPYDVVRDLEALQLWPAAIKEERDRKPRLLCDHSWPWGWPSINETTLAHAPAEAMQFGGALPRVLYLARHADQKRYGPVRGAKLDMKDGYYRLDLEPDDCPRLALILPRYEGEEQLVAIPLACTMGWIQSPPTFCVMSETTCDHANARFLASPKECPPHRLSHLAEAQDDLSPTLTLAPPSQEDKEADAKLQALVERPSSEPAPSDATDDWEPAPPSNRPLTKPLGHTDVFVDDFIQVGQGGKRRMRALRDHLLHAIDQVLEDPNLCCRKRAETVSLKKLLQGDGSFNTRKLILGWILDFSRQTLELPAHRKTMLADLFSSLQAKTRVGVKTWERMLGKLRFVSKAIPGAAGLFCCLQLALNKAKGNNARIRINRELRLHLDAFTALAADLSKRPTHLAEIVPQDPSYLGTTDAAKPGMGGVIFDHEGRPYLWRSPFPLDVQREIVSADNPHGRLTNSDLEHAAVQAQKAVLAHHFPVRYATLMNGTDNTPALAREQKGAISSSGTPARLCNYACAHQRQHRYCAQEFFISGEANVMADDTSRLFHLSDSALLAHFEQHYPQPHPWTMLHLPSDELTKLTSALRCNTPVELTLPRPTRPKTKSLGTGSSSALSSDSCLPSVTSYLKKLAWATCSSSPCDTEPKVSATSPSEVAQWIKPSWRWARGSPTWVPQTLASNLLTPMKTTQSCEPSSSDSTISTLRRKEPTPSISPLSEPFATPSTSMMPTGGSSTSTASTSSSQATTGCSAQLSAPAPKTRILDPKPSPSNPSCSRARTAWW